MFTNEMQRDEHAKLCHNYRPIVTSKEVRTRKKYPSPVTVKTSMSTAIIEDSPKRKEKEEKKALPKKYVIPKKKKSKVDGIELKELLNKEKESLLLCINMITLSLNTFIGTIVG